MDNTKLLKIAMGACLYEARKSAGLNQVDAAKLLKISQAELSRAERGFRFLDPYRLKLALEFYQMTTKEFMGLFK